MKTGDIVIWGMEMSWMTTDFSIIGENVEYTCMIISGPNEVGMIRILFPDGDTKWVPTADVKYPIPSVKYLHE